MAAGRNLSKGGLAMEKIRGAIHWWLCENCGGNQEVSEQIRPLLEHFFYCANSAYVALEVQPFPTVVGGGVSIRIGGRHNVCIVNKLSAADFFRLRGILALVGDMECIIREVRRLSDSLDNDALSTLLDSHLPNLKKYRYARNFFAHFDERIGVGKDRHGVTGELEVPELGIKFTKEADGCFYLRFQGDTLYYHDMQHGEKRPCAKSISLNSEGLLDIFCLVRDLYDLVTSHSVHATDYPPSESVYSLRQLPHRLCEYI